VFLSLFALVSMRNLVLLRV